MFVRQGVPEVMKSDNKPLFNGEKLATWSKYIGFQHCKVTPKWPAANGKAERFMQTLNKAVCTVELVKGKWKQEIFKFL